MPFLRKKDIPVFLIVVPFMTLVDYSITFATIVYDLDFFKTLFMDTMQGYVCWLVIRAIIIRMVKRKVFEHSTWKRLTLQFLLTFIASIAVCIIPHRTVDINGVKYAQNTDFFSHDLVIFLIWISIVNFIYIGMMYYEVWKTFEARLQSEQTLKTQGFTIKVGGKNTKIQIRDIHGFYVEDGCTYIIDSQYKSYIVDASLNALEEKLPERYFFRINRKFILHRNSIISYKRIEDNKLLIITPDIKPLPVEVTMSRLKAPAFKKWFEADVVLM